MIPFSALMKLAGSVGLPKEVVDSFQYFSSRKIEIHRVGTALKQSGKESVSRIDLSGSESGVETRIVIFATGKDAVEIGHLLNALQQIIEKGKRDA